MTLADAFTSFLKACEFEKNLSPYTIKAYSSDLLQFGRFAAQMHITELSTLTAEFLQDYIAHLKHQNGHSDSTIRRKIAVVRAFLKLLERRGILEENPTTKVRLSFKQARKLPVVLHRSEIEALLGTARRALRTEDGSGNNLQALRDYAFLELLFYTGARVGEVLKLNVEHCNFKTGFAHIRGKGRRDRIIYIGFSPVMNAVKKYLLKRQLLETSDPALFLSSRRRRLSVFSAERIVKKYATRAAIQLRVTPHVFRHTMATMMLENGADLRSIQEILGHASISTTEMYTHISTNRKRQVMLEFHPRTQFPIRLHAG